MVAATVLTVAGTCLAKSPKRGVCWDEHNVPLNTLHASQMQPGISWAYNWGPDPGVADAYSEEFAFVPMAWNGAFNEQRIRTWLAAHPETKYLLGFNEPNFADQARMTPAEAAAQWPRLKAIAKDFDLKLVAPALNFSASQVGGRVWNPYEWYDEFFKLCPDADVDCLAMHCYMNWYSANTWLATEYFYSDLYNPQKECYGRYPNLTAYLDSYKKVHAHFPRMMLTEFCSWENDGTISNVDFQIDQMTQKVQKLEQCDLVEGYAWFMANDGNGASAYPFMSLFERNSADSRLSTLGTVYTYMSDFDLDRKYEPGEIIDAKDYVEATTDDRRLRLRPNTEASSDRPLQVEIPAGGYPEYLIHVPHAELYSVIVHASSEEGSALTLYIDNKKQSAITVPASTGAWGNYGAELTLTEGTHRLMPYNSGSNPILINELYFDYANSVTDTEQSAMADIVALYDLSGRRVTDSINELGQGVYVVKMSDGTCHKILK